MKTYTIHTNHGEKTTEVFIGENIFAKLCEYIDDRVSSVMIVSDCNVGPLYKDAVVHALSGSFDVNRIHYVECKDGEDHKTLATITQIYTSFHSHAIDRKSMVIALGGGVICDMAGFAAATYMRGVPCMYIPTTLEAMVDAAVGGKTGVNFQSHKNMIGTFTQPTQVIADLATLKTLPTRAFVQGYAEVLKHGLIFDDLFFYTATKQNVKDLDGPELEKIIYESVKIKAQIVASDTTENGIRKILNFGHTLGHALESLSHKTTYPLFHGEAVAIGMVGEAYISFLRGDIKEEEFHQIEKAIQTAGLPIRYTEKAVYEDLAPYLAQDKKNASGKIHWSLLTSIGKCDFNIVVGESFIKRACAYILKNV